MARMGQRPLVPSMDIDSKRVAAHCAFSLSSSPIIRFAVERLGHNQNRPPSESRLASLLRQPAASRRRAGGGSTTCQGNMARNLSYGTGAKLPESPYTRNL